MVEMIALKAQRILLLNEEYYKWRLTKDLTPRPLYDEIKETTQAFEGRYIYHTCVCILMLIRIVIAQCGIAYYNLIEESCIYICHSHSHTSIYYFIPIIHTHVHIHTYVHIHILIIHLIYISYTYTGGASLSPTRKKGKVAKKVKWTKEMYFEVAYDLVYQDDFNKGRICMYSLYA